MINSAIDPHPRPALTPRSIELRAEALRVRDITLSAKCVLEERREPARIGEGVK